MTKVVSDRDRATMIRALGPEKFEELVQPVLELKVSMKLRRAFAEDMLVMCDRLIEQERILTEAKIRKAALTAEYLELVGVTYRTVH